MKFDFPKLIVGALMGLLIAGCTTTPRTGPEAAKTAASDPDARAFTGTIIGRKLALSTLIFSKDEHLGADSFPNQVYVKYDVQTKFFMDDQPATLDQLQLYMTGHIEGHMRNGQMFAESARFSSTLPNNVKRERE